MLPDPNRTLGRFLHLLPTEQADQEESDFQSFYDIIDMVSPSSASAAGDEIGRICLPG
jgi:hypothetical protein